MFPFPSRHRSSAGRRTAAAAWSTAALAFASLLFATLGTGAPQNLPDMGEPADATLSPLEEQRLGAEFMRQIRAGLPLVRDVQLEEYIQTLGMRLALASGKTGGRPFGFFIIDDESINAFAIPGGYVGINAGLIEAMEREEQLAGVVAHEVAHLTQRHHARSFATGGRTSLSAAAAVLAAVLIGQASPEAGQAALAAGIAATQQSTINFTRANEIEADRIGIEILGNAQYDATAMAESFSILRRQNNLNTFASGLEYLRTHPLDNDRIAEAADRAAGQPVRPSVPQTDFTLFKARLAVLTSDDPAQLERSYRAKLDGGTQERIGARYALALGALRASRVAEAATHIDALERLAPAHPMVELLRTDALEASGEERGSREHLAALADLYPERYSIVEKRVDQLMRAQRPGKAKDVVQRYLRDIDSPNPLAWRQLAGIHQRLGDAAASHESLARYFESLDELQSAESQLELALRNVVPGSQDELRLRASLRTLREEAARRRG